ncbi:MAG: portal protein [Candidatus Melainabacteria bacterium]|nr:portal protein [Candidatus Melainabacteria bacterium]
MTMVHPFHSFPEEPHFGKNLTQTDLIPSAATHSLETGSPTLSTLSPTQQQVLCQQIQQQYQQWKQARQTLENTWQECWQAYLCDLNSLYSEPDTQMQDRSRIARPVLYEAVEGIHANLLNALFSSGDRFFSVLGRTEADHEQARIIEEFLRDKLDDVQFSEKYALFLKQAIITGNSVAAVPWVRKHQQKTVTQPVSVFGVTIGQQRVRLNELIQNAPEFEVIDIFDFLIDPDAVNFSQANVIRRMSRSLQNLKQSGLYQNLEALQPKMPPATEADDQRGKRARRQAFGIQDSALTAGPNVTRADQIHLLEAWGTFWIDDTCYENYVCVVANGQHVIRFEPNPYEHGQKPFVFTTLIPVPNEVYGLGAIEKSLGLQHAINTLTNQKLDVINISINNPFTYLINDDVFDPNTVVTRPGALIPVKSHDTLRPIQYLNNFTVAFNEIADLKAEVQEATGALKFLTGSGGAFADVARTATEVSALVQGGSQKFSSIITHLEKNSLEPFLRLVFENGKQFLQQKEVVRVSRTDGTLEFITILPEVLQKTRCSFKINGSQSIQVKGRELEAIVAFIRLIQQDNALASQINRMELYRRIYRRLGFRDEEEIFNPGTDHSTPSLSPAPTVSLPQRPVRKSAPGTQ